MQSFLGQFLSKCESYEIYVSLYGLHILVSFYFSLLFLTKKITIYYNKTLF